MKIRKFVALVGAVTIFFACIFFYHLTDHTLFLQDDLSPKVQSGNVIYQKNKEISEGRSQSNEFINKVHGKWSQLKVERHNLGQSQKGMCKNLLRPASADIEMLDVYEELKFDNIDGGAWKQGWNIEIPLEKQENPLKVIVVPHSHNDPGWLKTFEDYYISETRDILINLLKKLTSDPRKKFIWAEVSFLSLWWDELSQDDQEKLKKLVDSKQLEIVTGGWVMNDEANSHYYSIVTQLTEGHQWMYSNLNKKPRNAWTIDPFGESPVMPFIFKKMGLERLVIQRVHYSVKKYLAQMRNLEFQWKQLWDEEGENNLLTHMMPFYSYDIPHTCGPDPKICCQFDFKRLPGNGVSCPWKESPRPIHKRNVAARAEMLLEQYRKKAELYRTNVILIPLGDDFRYQHSTEWDNQFENYYKIMDHINNNPSKKVQIKFGTLEDYFNALLEETPVEDFPTLTGDFFTYADRDDHYWSGYYTSRPYYKKMDRILIGYHRAAEIIYALSWGYRNVHSTDWLLSPQTGFAKMLRDVRRSLSLFQHHDGVTGTARDNVMEDYARKMLDAINYSQHIIQQCANFLLSSLGEPFTPNPEEIYFDFDDSRRNVHSLPERKLLIFKNGEIKRLVFYNPLTLRRKAVVSLYVFTPYVQILDADGNEVHTQTSPVFSHGSTMDESQYEIFFAVDIPALGLSSYTITPRLNNMNKTEGSLSKVIIYNSPDPIKTSVGFENSEVLYGNEFSIENNYITVNFSDTGLMKSVTCKETMTTMPMYLNFVRYLARHGKESSGAYLFLPKGEADIVRIKSPFIRVYTGSIYSRAEVFLVNVKHTVTIYNVPGFDNFGIEVVNLVDIRNENNYELAMRISSNIMNKDEFFTDLNGLQMIKRKRFAKLPLQGNFYPMPTAAYIQDEKSRLTVLSGQPLGVSSLKQGQIEVIQDRRLKQDDNRGLGQGVLDNQPTPNTFRILVERRTESCKSDHPLLSSKAYLSLQGLLYPNIKMMWRPDTPCNLGNSFEPVLKESEMDTHLVAVRTMNEETEPLAGFVMFRQHIDTCFYYPEKHSQSSNGLVNIDSLLPNHFGKAWKSSLSLLEQVEVLDRKSDQVLCQMDFLSIIFSR